MLGEMFDITCGGLTGVEERKFEQENKDVVVCLEKNRVTKKKGGSEQRKDGSGT